MNSEPTYIYTDQAHFQKAISLLEKIYFTDPNYKETLIKIVKNHKWIHRSTLKKISGKVKFEDFVFIPFKNRCCVPFLVVSRRSNPSETVKLAYFHSSSLSQDYFEYRNETQNRNYSGFSKKFLDSVKNIDPCWADPIFELFN